MRLVVLFSGQGQQTLAHRDELLAGDPLMVRWLDQALAPRGCSLSELTEARLTENRIAQVLIWGLQWLRWTRLDLAGWRPVLLAGYSAGETAAYTAAGLWPAEAGAGLAMARADFMSRVLEAQGKAAGLLAVSGCAPPELEAALQGLEAEVAIKLAETQVVVGGLAPALDCLVRRLKSGPDLRVTRLAVEIPAHTRWLQPASIPWGARLAEVPGPAPQFPLLSGTRAGVMRERADALAALTEQVYRPIAWNDCLDVIAEYQPEAVLELGPGTTLARLALQHGLTCPVRSVEEFRSTPAVLEWLERCAA